MSSPFWSSLISFTGLNSPAEEERSIRFWTVSAWLILWIIYAHDGKVGLSWPNSLFLQLRAPFPILGDFNQRLLAWGFNSTSSGADTQYDWLLNKNVCLMNSSQAIHIASSGRTSLIYLSFSSSDTFRTCRISVHPDSFSSDHFLSTLHLECSLDLAPLFITHVDWIGLHPWIPSFMRLIRSRFLSLHAAHSTCVHVRLKYNPPWWNSLCAWLLGQKRLYLWFSCSHLPRSFWILYHNLTDHLRRYMKDQARAYWTALCTSAWSRKLFQVFKDIHGRSPTAKSNIV